MTRQEVEALLLSFGRIRARGIGTDHEGAEGGGTDEAAALIVLAARIESLPARLLIKKLRPRYWQTEAERQHSNKLRLLLTDHPWPVIPKLQPEPN